MSINVEEIKARRARLGYVEFRPVVPLNLVRPRKTISAPIKVKPVSLDPKLDAVFQLVHYNQTPEELLNAVSVIKHRTPITTIIRMVSNELGIDQKTLLSDDKRQSVAYARFLIFWLCRKSGYSLPQIGRKVGDRDHTTVINGVRKFEKHLAEDGDLAPIARRLHVELISARPAPYWGA